MQRFLQNASAKRLFVAALLAAATLSMGLFAFVKGLEVVSELVNHGSEHKLIPPVHNPIQGEYVHASNRDEFLAFAGRQDIGILSFGREVGSDEFQIVSGISNVQFMICVEAKIKDADLKHISGLKKLEILRFYDVRVGDEGMTEVNKIKSLRELDLRHTDVTDAGLRKLTDLENLQALQVGGNIDGSGLLAMNLSKLKVATLQQKAVNDKALDVLPGCPDLIEVGLYNSSVTDEGLLTLACCRKLIWLDLRSTAVTDDGIMVLSQLKDLKFLDLRTTAVTSAGVRKLQRELPHCKIKYGNWDAANDFSGLVDILVMGLFMFGAIGTGFLLSNVIEKTPARAQS